MKRLATIILTLILAVLLGATLTGCDDGLVGRWEGVSVTATYFGEKMTEYLSQGEVFWELNGDGTGAIIEGRGRGRDEFSWRVERGQLYMTYRTGETVPMSYNIFGASLTIIMEDFGVDVDQSVMMTLRRVR